MKSWEIDIELRVRKTLCVSGPGNEAVVRTLIQHIMSGDQPIELQTFQKWKLSDYKPRAVETVIDNDPQIVAVREVADE